MPGGARGKSPGAKRANVRVNYMFTSLKAILTLIANDGGENKFYSDMSLVIKENKEKSCHNGQEEFIFAPWVNNKVYVSVRGGTHNKAYLNDTLMTSLMEKAAKYRKNASDLYSTYTGDSIIDFDTHVLRGLVPRAEEHDYSNIKTLTPVYIGSEQFSPGNVSFSFGTEYCLIDMWKYWLIVSLVCDVGQYKPVQEELLILLLNVFELEHYSPSTKLVAWYEFGTVIDTITASVFFFQYSDKYKDAIIYFISGMFFTVILYNVTTKFAELLPEVPECFSIRYEMPLTCAILSSSSFIVLVLYLIQSYYDEMKTPPDEDEYNIVHKNELIKCILEQLVDIQNKDYWLYNVRSQMHIHIAESLKHIPSIITAHVPHADGSRYIEMKTLSMILLLALFWFIMILFPKSLHDSVPQMGFFVIMYILYAKPDMTILYNIQFLVPNICMLAWPSIQTADHGQSSIVLDCVTVVCIYAVHFKAFLTLYRKGKNKDIAIQIFIWFCLVVVTIFGKFKIEDFGLTFCVFFVRTIAVRTSTEKLFDDYLRQLATNSESNR